VYRYWDTVRPHTRDHTGGVKRSCTFTSFANATPHAHCQLMIRTTVPLRRRRTQAAACPRREGQRPTLAEAAESTADLSGLPSRSRKHQGIVLSAFRAQKVRHGVSRRGTERPMAMFARKHPTHLGRHTLAGRSPSKEAVLAPTPCRPARRPTPPGQPQRPDPSLRQKRDVVGMSLSRAASHVFSDLRV